MNFDDELDLDDDWGSWEDENRIWEMECAYCGTKMKRRGFNFTCPECGCRCFTDTQGNTQWDTKKFKDNPNLLISEKQKRAVWICNHYGGHEYFTLSKREAFIFLSKYFEESCAMKEAQEEQRYEELAEEGLLPDESELF